MEFRFDRKPVHAKRVLREVQILRQVDSIHVVRLRDVCLAGGVMSSQQLFLVFDRCDGDLQESISKGPALDEARVAELLQDILGGVACLHTLAILHRDLKPANCLLKGGRALLGDLGLSRLPSGAAAPAGAAPPATGHVATSWYRSPELLLSEPYGAPADVWSLGWIFGELLQLAPSGGGGRPLFDGRRSAFSPWGDCRAPSSEPGEDQLAAVVRVLGPPPWLPAGQASAYDGVSKFVLAEARKALADAPVALLSELVPNATPTALVLLRELLAFEPAARPTARKALGHRFLTGLAPVPVPEMPPRPLEASSVFEATDEELWDPRRRDELSVRFQSELSACCGPRWSSSPV